MDSSRLRELIDLLLEREEQTNLQRRLVGLRDHLQQLAGNPQNQQMQLAVSSALTDVRNGTGEMGRDLIPPKSLT